MAPRADLAAALALAPFVAMLGCLSTASLVAALATVPHAATIAAAEIGAPVDPTAARAAAAASEWAAGWFDAPFYQLRAARALLALPTAERRRLAPRIEALDRAALAAAPMSPYGWTLLAFLRLDRRDRVGAVRAWRMSLRVGRYVPDLMRARLLLGIALMPYDATLHRSVGDQIRLLADTDPSGLATLARRSGIEPLVRATLADTPESQAFEQATRALAMGAGGRLAGGARR